MCFPLCGNRSWRKVAAAADPLGDDGDAYKRAILERFPSHGGPFLVDIGNRYLFGDPGA
jgi:hypothetical protein